jgi:hypothetical protein
VPTIYTTQRSSRVALTVALIGSTTLRNVRINRAASLLCLASALAACTSAPPVTPEPGPRYTCCEAGELERVYQAGETLTIHWIVNPAARINGEIELNAQMTGPFATANDLKAGSGGGSQALSAEPIHPTGDVDERPASVIVIPPTARSGLYNLVMSRTEPGAKVSSAHIIRVVTES